MFEEFAPKHDLADPQDFCAADLVGLGDDTDAAASAILMGDWSHVIRLSELDPDAKRVDS